jgi:putative transposase
MRKSRFSEEQIIRILERVETGELVKDVCREIGVAENTYYRWKSKYGGMGVSERNCQMLWIGRS